MATQPNLLELPTTAVGRSEHRTSRFRDLVGFPTRPKGQLLKWIGSKFKFANQIVSYFPQEFDRFIEPFVGTGAILATVAPSKGVASDSLKPLIELWNLLQNGPEELIEYYERAITDFYVDRQRVYERILRKYNDSPNPFDLLVISRTCYGGVMRFTREGKISTPIGPHKPIPPEAFAERAQEWRERVKNVRFLHQSFVDTFALVMAGDLVYCDPPYIDSQAILYGAQDFKFSELIAQIAKCKGKGAWVALSIDGTKKSGRKVVKLNIPDHLFKREIYISSGSSMLKRFQNGGELMIGEDVADRLLLTW